MDKGYRIIFNGTDNYSMLIDLRTKFPDLTGMVAEIVDFPLTRVFPFRRQGIFPCSGSQRSLFQRFRL